MQKYNKESSGNWFMYQAKHGVTTHSKQGKKSNSVFQAAGILMITMFLSRILGFVRDIVITGMFSFGYQTDAYYAAFTIPDLIYFALVGGALSSAFIPVFSGYLATKKEKDGYIVASTILNLVSLASLVLIIFGLIFTPQLVRMLVQFPEESFALTVLLTRVMFAQSFFMCLAGISQGILQSYKEFAAPAFGAVVYNIAIIVVGLLLQQKFGIMGFSIGVVVGSVLNLAMQIQAMVRYRFAFRLVIDLHHPGVRRFFLLLLPVVLGLSVNELNLLVSQYLGSGLGDGVLSALKNAQRVMMLPVGIFAAAIGLSIFPTMTRHVARGEMQEYKQNLTMGLRTIIFITLPAAVGLMVLRYPMVRAMYLQFAVTKENIDMISVILFYYCIGIVGYSAQQILNRGYYAVQDTKSPVKINMFILLFNIVLSFLLVGPLAYRGLALAYSISGLLSMVVLGLGLRKRIGPYGGKALLKSALQSIIAAAVMGLVVSFTAGTLEQLLDMSSKFMQVGQVLISAGVGTVVYATMVIVMKMEEAQLLLQIIKRKIGR